jgi:hypothetical protein
MITGNRERGQELSPRQEFRTQRMQRTDQILLKGQDLGKKGGKQNEQ